MMLHYRGQIIFILGCQRSGTTLLSHILSSPPGTLLFDHDRYIGMHLQEFARMINDAAERANCCVKGPQLVMKQRWVSNFDAKIVWIFRDPAEVIMSMLALDGWLDHYERNEKKLTGTPQEKCAKIWVEKNSQSFYYEPVFIHYKDLCLEPRRILEGLCSVLSIPFHDIMLEHHEVESDNSIGKYNPKRPISFRERRIPTELQDLSVEISGLYEELLGRSI